MSTQNIIILIVAIVIIIILFRIITKVFLRIIIFLAFAGVISYLLFFYNGGFLHPDKRGFILNELQSKYCIEKLDSVKCECIINPLMIDLKRKYTAEQIAELSEDPLKTGQVLLQVLNDNKLEIKACLKEKNADYAWEGFINDLKSLKLSDKLKKIFDPVKPED
jgi:hypothetical protein